MEQKTTPPTVHFGENPAHRACAHCRSQKVRCLPDDQNPDVCQRCARAGRPCVFTPLQKRRQRKRTDTRVAELEREMRAMRSMLKDKNAKTPEDHEPDVDAEASPPRSSETASWYRHAYPESQTVGHASPSAMHDAAALRKASEAIIPAVTNPRDEDYDSIVSRKRPARPPTADPDVIDRGFLTMDKATRMFEKFRTQHAPLWPVIHIPPSLSAEDVRRSRPMLFLAILAAVADNADAELSARLDQEVVVSFATRSFIRSEKSLELVQTLLVSIVWYHPPRNFGQLKYYEYVHLCAAMALDIGIGTKPLPNKTRAKRQAAPARQPLMASEALMTSDGKPETYWMNPHNEDVTDDAECRRAFVTCYIVCASVSMSLKRPTMLRQSAYIKDCLEYLESAPDALPSDRTLTAWARLCGIADDIGTAFALDDPDNIAKISNLRTQILLRTFDQALTDWLANTAETDLVPPLMVMYYTVRIYAFEIALHLDHSPHDFKVPYELGTIQPSEDEVPSQLLAEAVAECVAAAHGSVNTMMKLSAEDLLAFPGFTFIRVSFGVFVLTKLNLSAAHPQSRIGRVLDRSSLKAEQTVEKLILHMRNCDGFSRSRVLSIMLALLFKMRQWCGQGSAPQRGKENAHEGTAFTNRQARASAPLRQSMDGVASSGHGSSSEHSPQSVPGMTQNNMVAPQFGPNPNLASNMSHPGHVNSMRVQAHSNNQPMPQHQHAGAFFGMPQNDVSYQMSQPEPMITDSELMQLWEDVSKGLPEGGLTGLDDWTGIAFSPNTDVWGMPQFGGNAMQ